MKMMLEDLEVNVMHWNNKRLTLPTTQKAVISVNAQPHALVDPAFYRMLVDPQNYFDCGTRQWSPCY
jgi:hypothetical protein